MPPKGKATQLFWDSETVFGGLHMAVQAMAYGSGIFYLTRKKDRSFNSAQEEYASVLVELKDRFGKSHKSGETDGYPWARWHWGDVCLNIAIGERFVDYVVLSVSKGVIENDL